jgi:hypothetical protein
MKLIIIGLIIILISQKEILSQNKIILTMNQDLLKALGSPIIIVNNENNLMNKEE